MRAPSRWSYFISKPPLTSSGLNHCPKSRSKFISPSGLNNVGSKSSRWLATLCMKSVENRFADIGSDIGCDDWPIGTPSIADGDGAMFGFCPPGPGVGGLVPPALGVCPGFGWLRGEPSGCPFDGFGSLFWPFWSFGGPPMAGDGGGIMPPIGLFCPILLGPAPGLNCGPRPCPCGPPGLKEGSDPAGDPAPPGIPPCPGILCLCMLCSDCRYCNSLAWFCWCCNKGENQRQHSYEERPSQDESQQTCCCPDIAPCPGCPPMPWTIIPPIFPGPGPPIPDIPIGTMPGCPPGCGLPFIEPIGPPMGGCRINICGFPMFIWGFIWWGQPGPPGCPGWGKPAIGFPMFSSCPPGPPPNGDLRIRFRSGGDDSFRGSVSCCA